MTHEQCKDRIEALEEQVRYWMACYRKAISHDHRVIEKLKEAQHDQPTPQH